MTASAGASSALGNWKTIDWDSVKQHVKRLQMRIAKAIKEDNTAEPNLCSGYFLTRIMPSYWL